MKILVALISLALGVLAFVVIYENTAPSLGESRADAMGVTIIWTADNRNCADGGLGGCFDSATPDVIYVTPDMGKKLSDHVILHELAHVQQHRAGESLDECGADAQAQAWGSTVDLTHQKECGKVGS